MLESGRILLLTNDDGVDAPGLAVLADVARGFGTAHIVAPSGPRSGCGHTFNTHAVFGFEPRGERRHSVDGSPVDCVRLGLHHLAPNAEWVLSGINDGGNLGVDVYASGTVAAVREATLLGRPAIALSQYIAAGRPIDWERSARMATRVLEYLFAKPPDPGCYWTASLPHLASDAPEPELVECPIDHSPRRLDYDVEGDRARFRGVYQDRARLPGHDIDVCFSGSIAISHARPAG